MTLLWLFLNAHQSGRIGLTFYPPNSCAFLSVTGVARMFATIPNLKKVFLPIAPETIICYS